MRRTLALALVLALVAVGAGVLVTIQTFPSDKEIQRLSFEELGLDGTILDNPLFGTFVQEIFGDMQERVSDRVLKESRKSMYLGGGTMVLITVVGVVLIATDHRRRSPGDPEV